MKKQIKKLFTLILVVASIVGNSLTTCAYEVSVGEKDNNCGPLTLSPTPIYYETSKYPELNLVTHTGYLSKLKNDMKPTRVNSQVFNVYYDGKLGTKQHNSGIILLGVKLNKEKIANNAMAAFRLNKVDIKNTYVATYDIDAKYNALVRLEPSYSVFGNGDNMDLQLKYRINPKSLDCVFYLEFKIGNRLIMDNFDVTIKSVDGKYSYTVGADVLNYEGADIYSDEDAASEGRATFIRSPKQIDFTITTNIYYVYFNDICVGVLKPSDYRLEKWRKDGYMEY